MTSRIAFIAAVSALFVVTGCACNGGDRVVLVDVYTDLRPGVEFTAVRVEMSDTPFSAPGRVITAPLHDASNDEPYLEGVRVATLEVPHCERVHVRVALLDASGRRRGERVAEVPDECATRAVRIDIALACAGVTCASGERCVTGTCVPVDCEGDGGACGTSCASDAECPAPALGCQSPVCTEVGCFAADDCPASEYCAPGGCTPRPVCGDGGCDASTETPCACPADCAAAVCPDGCGDGACDSSTESTESCPEDCGPPPFVCGDRICEVLETCDADCGGGSTTICGTETCETGETCAAGCSECCEPGCEDADCEPGCGDGTCSPSEDTCPLDCPVELCGNGRCDEGEDATCPADCPAGAAVCGDADCVVGEESCVSCQADCGWCSGEIEVPMDRSCLGVGSGGASVCGDLAGAHTAAAVNIAYWPMTVVEEEEGRLGPMGERGVAIYSADGQAVGHVALGEPFAVQSTRNPSCAPNPPLRPRLHGYAFGYAPGVASLEASVGWVKFDHLLLYDQPGAPCAYGPQGESFAVRGNVYSRPLACAEIACADGGAPRTCRDANPDGEGAGDCGGTSADRRVTVSAATLWHRYSPGGPPRRILHAGDTLRVHYDNGAGWYFARIATSGHPMLNPPGSIGWVRSTSVTP